MKRTENLSPFIVMDIVKKKLLPSRTVFISKWDSLI